nr:MAG TPA: hypothetical protein [Bacteriophage sp.]
MTNLVAVSFEVPLFSFSLKNKHSPNCFVSLALKFHLPFLYK